MAPLAHLVPVWSKLHAEIISDGRLILWQDLFADIKGFKSFLKEQGLGFGLMMTGG